MRKLGKYELLGELGRGAFGIVYRARDPIINRMVALKTVTTYAADNPNLLQRFYREAQSAGSLQHPNIVTIYDMGEEGGTPFIAMELIDGQNLDDLIARRPALPVALKLVYGAQACRAFDYAHKRGIIHRDIKPGNVMVNKEGTVKVVDFGIARVLDTSKTQTGTLIGTFSYMPPEIFHGEHADERSDIWSFGVLLYELLAYKRPFGGDSPAALMQSVCMQEPVPLRQLAPDCPEDLESVVHRTLRKSEQERFQTMEDLLVELEPICKRLQAETVAELLVQTQQLVEQREFEQARDRLRQALQVDSTNQQARSLSEKVNVELKRISVRPKAQEHVEKGRALLQEGKLQEANAEARNALLLDSRFEPALELQREVQREIERAQLVNEWLQLLEHRLVEGLPDEAEALLVKVQEADPSNPQLLGLRQQVLEEKARRQRQVRLFESTQQARAFWARQKYQDCIDLLTQLQKEFAGEEEIERLLETAREDQAEQNKQERLTEARNLLAMRQYDKCIAGLAKLQADFPADEEIRRLLDTARTDHAEQNKEESLVGARKLLAARRHEECIALLTKLREDFPGDDEIERLLETAREDQDEQNKQEKLSEARDLLAARRYDECIGLLAALEEQFPGEDEIHRLLETASADQIEHKKQEKLAEARKLLAARSYDECIAVLVKLQAEFPGEDEIARLLETASEDKAKQNKQTKLVEARKLLAERRYGDSIALLTRLLQEFPGDEEIRRALNSAHSEEAEQNKRERLTEVRNLLAARHYSECVAVLVKLQQEFPGNDEIDRLLETARQDQAEQNRQEKLAEARNLLAARRYEQCIALLTKLQEDFACDIEVRTLLDTAREQQAEQNKQRKLADARKLLSARRYEECIALLASIQQEFVGDTEVQKLLDSACVDQAEQYKREKLAEARKLLSARRYEECITLLGRLQQERPDDEEIAKSLRTAHEDQVEFDRKQKLAQARDLVAAQQFADAMAVLEPLLAADPKDSAVLKLRTLVQRELEKQAKSQTLQREWENLKKLDGEKAYTEVVARGEKLLREFPGEADLIRLVEFARAQQVQRERELRLRKSLDQVHGLMKAGRFTDAAAAARAGLESFPDNAELISLLWQAQAQEKKEFIRQLIERRVREIKVKINRGQLSDAKKLAEETIATVGPDTDVKQLLTSAEVEYHAREKKKEQDRKLETVRTLVDAGKLTEATISLDEAIKGDDFDILDPRVYTLSEEIEAARRAAYPSPPTVAAKPEGPAREYVVQERSPLPTHDPAVEAAPQAVQEIATGPSAMAFPSEVPVLPENMSVSSIPEVQPAEAPQELSSPAPESLQVSARAMPDAAEVPSVSVAAPQVAPPEPETVLIHPEQETILVPSELEPAFRRAEPAKTPPTPGTESREAVMPQVPPIWIRAVAMGALVVVAAGLVWFALRPKPAATKPSPPAAQKVQSNPLEAQQRDLMAKADALVVKNDLEGARTNLRQARDLNGPSASDIDKKLTQVEAGINDVALRKLLQQEEQWWQQAQDLTEKGRFTEAGQYLNRILELPEGGRHKDEARHYLDKVIPERQHEERQFAEALRAMKRADASSLDLANELFGQVAAMNGHRKAEALAFQHKIQETLANRKAAPLVASARQDIKRGDFRSARQKAAQLQQMGRDSTALSGDINQAEQSRFARLQASLNQLKLGDDNNTVEALINLQGQFQVLADSSGPVANDARRAAASIPDAVRDVQTRAANRGAESAFQQTVQSYQRASSTKDKSALEASRKDFQNIAHGGGPRATDAQKYADQISTELAAMNRPAPAPPPSSNRPTLIPAVDDEASVRAVVDRYVDAYQKRSAEVLRQVWPTMDSKRYGEFKQSFGMASAIRMHVEIDKVTIASDRSAATVSGSVSQSYTPRKGKAQTSTDRIVFQMGKSNGTWTIEDVQ